MSDLKYLHGFSKEEQDRLVEQAKILAPVLHQDLHWNDALEILEVASGVGAQSKILLKSFPNIRLTGIDASDSQLEVANQYLADEIASGRCRLQKADAMSMPFALDSFDGAYLCWILEHLPNPQRCLNEVFRVLKSGAKVAINEVQNNTFFVHPYSPATLKYWYEFNDHQWNLGGDPFVGSKLGNYLKAAGFERIALKVRNLHFDNREPERRAERIDFWIRLLLSGSAELLKAGKVDSETVEEMKRELSALKKDPNSVFFFNFIYAEAFKP